MLDLLNALDRQERQLDKWFPKATAATPQASTSAPTAPLTFRRFAESPDYCGLVLSPVVGAIVDASEGAPVAIDDATSLAHFFCVPSEIPKRHRTVTIRAGARGGKTSRLLAPKALHAAWTVPLPTLRKGEIAAALIIAPDLDLARQALSFCKGYVDDSPVLSAAKVSENTESITLRRPDGKRVKIQVRAASRGGKGARGKTLVFAGLDEACFFRDEATGVVNDREMYRAAIARIVPGGQLWIVSTPWVAGIGLVEDLLAKNLGTHEHSLCAVAPTKALNPGWDPDGEISADLIDDDNDNYEREILAIPLVSGSTQFFSHEAIKTSVDESRPIELQYDAGTTYSCGGDLGLKRDSATLVIVGERDGIYHLAAYEELRPEKGQPLKLESVVDHFATTMLRFNQREFVADSHYREEARVLFEQCGMSLLNGADGQSGKAESHVVAKTALHEGKCRFPNVPRFLKQLRSVVAKPAPGGGLTISSPRTTTGGHGDIVSAWVLAMWALRRPVKKSVVTYSGHLPI